MTDGLWRHARWMGRSPLFRGRFGSAPQRTKESTTSSPSAARSSPIAWCSAVAPKSSAASKSLVVRATRGSLRNARMVLSSPVSTRFRQIAAPPHRGESSHSPTTAKAKASGVRPLPSRAWTSWPRSMSSSTTRALTLLSAVQIVVAAMMDATCRSDAPPARQARTWSPQLRPSSEGAGSASWVAIQSSSVSRAVRRTASALPSFTMGGCLEAHHRSKALGATTVQH